MNRRRYAVVLLSVSGVFLIVGFALVLQHTPAGLILGGIFLTWGLGGVLSLFRRTTTRREGVRAKSGIEPPDGIMNEPVMAPR